MRLRHALLTAVLCLGLALPTTSSASADISSLPPATEVQRLHTMQFEQPPARVLTQVESAIAQNPDHVFLWEYKAQLHLQNVEHVGMLRKRGQIRAALEAFEQAASLDNYAFRAQGFLYMLYSSLPGIAGGDDTKAAAKLDELTALGQGMAEYALAMRAQLAQQQGETAPYIDHLYNALADVESGSEHALYYRMSIAQAYQQQDEIEQALAVLAEANSTQQDHPMLRVMRAELAVQQQQVSTELMDDLDALLANSADAPPRFVADRVVLIRARAHQLTGEQALARAGYTAVQERAPSLIERMQYQEFIAQL